MKKSKLLKCAFICGCVLAPIAANADAADADAREETQAPTIHLGGVTANPGFSVLEKNNDNILSSDVNKRSSLITVISPSVLLTTKHEDDDYTLRYRADVGRYSQSAADNFVDQDLLGAAKLSLSTRAILNLTPEFKSVHDDRGSLYAILTPVPNTYHNSGVAGSFAYGDNESKGRIEVSAGYHDLQYQNNRTLTVAYDRKLSDMGGIFYYRLSPKISTFVQMTDLRIAYKDSASSLSGSELRYLLGATWDATAQTSGTFKVGQLQKKFDRVNPNFTGASWEGNVIWSPRDFIHLGWISSRLSTESTGVGSFVLITNNSLSFGYDLNELTNLHLNVGKQNADFTNVARTDRTPSYGLKLDYKFRSWLIGSLEYTDASRTSTGYTGINPNYTQKILAVSLHSEY